MADIPDANTVGRTTLFMSSSVIPIGSMRYGRRTGLRIRLNPYQKGLRSVLDRRWAATTGRLETVLIKKSGDEDKAEEQARAIVEKIETSGG